MTETQRRSHACAVCAKGKRRCDGSRPCARCKRLHIESKCIDAPVKANSSRKRRKTPHDDTSHTVVHSTRYTKRPATGAGISNTTRTSTRTHLPSAKLTDNSYNLRETKNSSLSLSRDSSTDSSLTVDGSLLRSSSFIDRPSNVQLIDESTATSAKQIGTYRARDGSGLRATMGISSTVPITHNNHWPYNEYEYKPSNSFVPHNGRGQTASMSQSSHSRMISSDGHPHPYQYGTDENPLYKQHNLSIEHEQARGHKPIQQRNNQFRDQELASMQHGPNQFRDQEPASMQQRNNQFRDQELASMQHGPNQFRGQELAPLQQRNNQFRDQEPNQFRPDIVQGPSSMYQTTVSHDHLRGRNRLLNHVQNSRHVGYDGYISNSIPMTDVSLIDPYNRTYQSSHVTHGRSSNSPHTLSLSNFITNPSRVEDEDELDDSTPLAHSLVHNSTSIPTREQLPNPRHRSWSARDAMYTTRLTEGITHPYQEDSGPSPTSMLSIPPIPIITNTKPSITYYHDPSTMSSRRNSSEMRFNTSSHTTNTFVSNSMMDNGLNSSSTITNVERLGGGYNEPRLVFSRETTSPVHDDEVISNPSRIVDTISSGNPNVGLDVTTDTRTNLLFSTPTGQMDSGIPDVYLTTLQSNSRRRASSANSEDLVAMSIHVEDQPNGASQSIPVSQTNTTAGSRTYSSIQHSNIDVQLATTTEAETATNIDVQQSRITRTAEMTTSIDAQPSTTARTAEMTTNIDAQLSPTTRTEMTTTNHNTAIVSNQRTCTHVASNTTTIPINIKDTISTNYTIHPSPASSKHPSHQRVSSTQFETEETEQKEFDEELDQLTVPAIKLEHDLSENGQSAIKHAYINQAAQQAFGRSLNDVRDALLDGRGLIWIHPETASTRYDAIAQAHSIGARKYDFCGKYLRKVQHMEGEELFDVFSARERVEVELGTQPESSNSDTASKELLVSVVRTTLHDISPCPSEQVIAKSDGTMYVIRDGKRECVVSTEQDETHETESTTVPATTTASTGLDDTRHRADSASSQFSISSIKSFFDSFR